MIDAISSAVSKTNVKNLISITAGSASVAATATVSSIKTKLPIIPDPALIKKQAEATAQLKVTDAKEKALKLKDIAVATAKSAVVAAVAGKLRSLIPKLPVVDPKILQALSVAKKIKDLAKERKAASVENLSKNKETFKFPMKPQITVPKVPVIPKIPDVRTIASPVPTPTPVRQPAPTPAVSTSPIAPRRYADTAGKFDEVNGRPLDDAYGGLFAREAFMRDEVIRNQEARVARGQRFVDFQAQRLSKSPDDVSIQSSYKNALRVQNINVTNLQKMKSDPRLRFDLGQSAQ